MIKDYIEENNLNYNKEKIINELTKENDNLFKQLNIVQEELEKKHLEYTEYNKILGPTDSHFFVKNILIENLKLQSLVNLQKIAFKIEKENSLESRLGNVLIKGVSSVREFIILPFKLYRIWKALEQKNPPSALGGETFHKVLDAYNDKGIDAVEKLLNSYFLSPVMRANAYTALARQLKSSNAHKAATLARMAWETDPRPYRLKWLAFRLHEAGDPITAEAILNILPLDINMTESEKRHSESIYKDSNIEATNEANKTLITYLSTSKKENYVISEVDHSSEEIKSQYKNLSDQFVKIKSEHAQELAYLNKQLSEQVIETEKAKQEVRNMKEIQLRQQKEIDEQKKESEDLTLRTAFILKNLLIQFESNKNILSSIIRIITGDTNNKIRQ